MIRRYSELVRLSSFSERFSYLKLDGSVGRETFGFDRYFNQAYYHSQEWKRLRSKIIARDLGCDLGVEDCPIVGRIVIHHMNPITIIDLAESTEFLSDPEYLICVSLDTHDAIHYGDESFLENRTFAERRKNDTCPWLT